MQMSRLSCLHATSGANWVQGTETPNGPVNPIWDLVQKYKLRTQFNDWFGSMSECRHISRMRSRSAKHKAATYDATGYVDYLDKFDDAGDQFEELTVAAGARVQQQLVDLTSRGGYSYIGAKPKTPQEMACEYYNLDWESGKYGLMCFPVVSLT